MDRKDAFIKHYNDNLFQGKQSKSGPGSDIDQTATIKNELVKLCNNLDVELLLDIPCGDCMWVQDIWNELDIQYIGADIVPDLIANNIKKYPQGTNTFILLDAVVDILPDVDLMLCRDCLVHLTTESSLKVLKNFANSNIPYLLTTTFTKSNRDNGNYNNVGKNSLTIEGSLQNAPDRKGNFFKVPPIIEVE